MLFLLLQSLPVAADGLQPGARIRCVQKGTSFTGTITRIYPEQETLAVIDRSGETILVPLAELESVRALNRRWFIMPWESPDEEPLPQFEFRTTDGTRVVGVADPEPAFDLKTGTSGVARTIGLEELQLIEVE